MPREQQPGIYLEIKGLSGSTPAPDGLIDYKHAYLVYRKQDGTTEFLRGGWTSPFRLEIETGLSEATSDDSNPKFETRPSRRLPIDGKEIAETWQKMRSRAEEIGQANLMYDPFIPGDGTPEQTSNSVVRAALDAGGIDPADALPEGVTERDIPGYENDLVDALKRRSAEKRAARARQDIRDKTRDGAEQRKALRDFQRGLGEDAAGGLLPDAPANDDRPAAPDAGAESPGPGADGTGAASPEAEALTRALLPAGGGDARDTLMLKEVGDLTEAESTDLARWYWDLPASDPMRGKIDERRRDYYALNYGTGPAETDATGRMIRPVPIRELPETPSPVRAADGGTLADGLKRIVGGLAKAAASDGAGAVTQALQTGLNLLGGQTLKVDGEPGPKTRAALADVVAKKGAAKAEEAVALGAFGRFAEHERAGGSASGLKETVETKVQPLFGSMRPRAAAETLQESLNGLADETAKAKKMPAPAALKIDGDLGSKTTDGFRSALMEHGPDRVTKRFADNLGFGL